MKTNQSKLDSMVRSLILLPWTTFLVILSAAPALMPLPVKVDAGSGSLIVDGSFSISVAECSDARLPRAANRITARIARQTGIPIGLGKPPAGSVSLRVECASAGPEYPSLGDDESYQLDVSSDGARLKAATGAGALHGLETFVQLIETGQNGFYVASAHIEDRPRFPWRGLMLDVSRHWMPIEVVERNLDAMAAVKLNVFHWHLSDDQGFRVESKRFPRLQELGSDGYFYTQDQIREVVAYARDRGIRVVPEFDIPGHTQRLVRRLSGIGQRVRPLRNRAHLGHLRSRDGPDSQGELYDSSTPSSARWPRSSPTPISTSAAMK